jgi:hypothetical protein
MPGAAAGDRGSARGRPDRVWRCNQTLHVPPTPGPPQLKHAKVSRELAISAAAEQAAVAAQAVLTEEMRELSGTCRWVAVQRRPPRVEEK